MAKSNKYNDKDPSIRGGSRKSEMDAKKRLHKLSGGRPARLKALLDAQVQEELEAIRKETERKAKLEAEAKAKEEASAKKSSPKKSKPKKSKKTEE